MNFDTDTYPSIEKLLTEVEEVTEKPATIIMDASVKDILSTHKTARGDQAFHIIRINENYSSIRHVLAAVQLRFLLRRAKIKGSQKDLMASQNASGELEKILRKAKSGEIPETAIPQLAQRLTGGFVTQLRSVLPAVMVHREIATLQPELAGQQRQALIININNNAANLGPAPFPKKLLQWNRQMSAIEACGFASLANDRSLLIPFEALDLISKISGLVQPLLDGAYDDKDDRELVEMTAKHIDMTGLHQWV
jgi:hypothetical protein